VWQLDLNITVVHPVWHTTQDPCEAVAEMSMLSRNRGYLLARAVTAVQDASVRYLVLCALSAIKNHRSTNEIRLELTKNVNCITVLSNPPSVIWFVIPVVSLYTITELINCRTQLSGGSIYVVYYTGINYMFRLLWPSSG